MSAKCLPQARRQHRISLLLPTTDLARCQLCVELFGLFQDSSADARVARTNCQTLKDRPQSPLAVRHEIPHVVALEATHHRRMLLRHDYGAKAAFGQQMVDGKAAAAGVTPVASVVTAEPTVLGVVVQRNIHDGAAPCANHFGTIIC